MYTIIFNLLGLLPVYSFYMFSSAVEFVKNCVFACCLLYAMSQVSYIYTLSYILYIVTYHLYSPMSLFLELLRQSDLVI